jgi:hypothetical protein
VLVVVLDGAAQDVNKVWTPVEPQTSSNALVNLVSRSRIRNLKHGGTVAEVQEEVAGLLGQDHPTAPAATNQPHDPPRRRLVDSPIPFAVSHRSSHSR